MAKPYPKFGPYNVIADTNALFAPDSRKLVSAGFETALTELRKLAGVQLYIPEVVMIALGGQHVSRVFIGDDPIVHVVAHDIRIQKVSVADFHPDSQQQSPAKPRR